MIVDLTSFFVRMVDGMRRADRSLSLFNCLKNSGGKKSENGGAEAGYFAAGHKDWPAQNIRINLIQHSVALRDSAGIYHAVDANTVFRHSVQYDAGVKCGAFDGGEEFVLRCVLQIPSKRHATKICVNQDSAVAVVPGHAQQARLTRGIFFEAFAEFLNTCAGSARDRFEDITRCGKPGFDAGVIRMNASFYDATYSGDQLRLTGDSDDAGGSADDVDDVALVGARADGIPVSVESSDGNRDAGAQSKLFRPIRRQRSGEVVGCLVRTLELRAHAGEQRIDLG